MSWEISHTGDEHAGRLMPSYSRIANLGLLAKVYLDSAEWFTVSRLFSQDTVDDEHRVPHGLAGRQADIFRKLSELPELTAGDRGYGTLAGRLADAGERAHEAKEDWVWSL